MRTLRKNSKEFKETLDKFLTIDGQPLAYVTIYDDSFLLQLKNDCDKRWVYSKNNISIVKVTNEEMAEKENYLGSNAYFKNSIYDAYDRPSYAKVSSYETLEKVYKDWDNTKVTGYSCHNYSYCACKTLVEGVMLFAKKTSCNSYLTIYIVEYCITCLLVSSIKELVKYI